MPGRRVSVARPSSTGSSSRRRSPTPASTCCASASTSTLGTDWADGGAGRARSASYDGDPDPLGHASSTADLIERADQPEGDRPRRHRRRQRRRRRPPPSAASSSPTRRSRTSIAAAEHTLALMLALARNIPQAHALARRRRVGALASSAASRSTRRRSGVLGFGRIGQLVAAARARASACASSPSTRSSAAERFRELGVEQAESSDDLYARADFITIHLPEDAGDRDWLDAEAFAQMKDGVRVINCARGELVDDEALKAALDSGKVAGAALDVFREEPITDHPLFGYPNVVVTPHLGASTAEAQDRAGVQTAEQVVAALTGGVVTTAVNMPGRRAPRTWRCSARSCRSARSSARLATARRAHVGRRASRSSTSAGSPSATPACSVAVLKGVLAGPHRGGRQPRQRARARRGARDRGLRDASSSHARDFTDLVRVTVVSGGERDRVVGTTLGRCTARTCSRPGASASTSSSRATSRCSATRTGPGCSAASARSSASAASTSSPPPSGAAARGRGGGAVMVVTADCPVPREVVDGIVGRRRLRRRPRRQPLAARRSSTRSSAASTPHERRTRSAGTAAAESSTD